MSNASMVITAPSGVVITTDNRNIALSFWHDGASVEYANSEMPVFGEYIKHESKSPKPVFPVWLNEHEKDQLIAHWEKTGMFKTVIEKIRAVAATKGSSKK